MELLNELPFPVLKGWQEYFAAINGDSSKAYVTPEQAMDYFRKLYQGRR